MSQAIAKPTEASVVRQPCVSLKEVREDLEAPREAREAARVAVRDAATKEIAAASEYAGEGRELCAKYRHNVEAFVRPSRSRPSLPRLRSGS